jgi:nitrite reductase (NO-forming)
VWSTAMNLLDRMLRQTVSAAALLLLLAAGAPASAHDMPGMEGMAGTPKPPLPAGVTDIVRDPSDLPPEIGNRPPAHIVVNLETAEVLGRLDDGATYRYWTFGGKVPGPFIRVRVGDEVEIRLHNAAGSTMQHTIDLHAVTGPGGGASASAVMPGETKSFSFKALNPGLFIYHCATPMHAMHISNGMFGLILVEPEGGLPKVDREFYVVQSELYTEQKLGAKGEYTLDYDRLLDERPTIFTFNGAVKALTGEHEMKARTGETVRIYFGDAGPNFTSSLHMIGEIFDKAYAFADLTSPPLRNVQTILVPSGGAVAVELKPRVPGEFLMLDHSMSRLEKGLGAILHVDGKPDPTIFNPHPAAARITGD